MQFSLSRPMKIRGNRRGEIAIGVALQSFCYYNERERLVCIRGRIFSRARIVSLLVPLQTTHCALGNQVAFVERGFFHTLSLLYVNDGYIRVLEEVTIQLLAPFLRLPLLVAISLSLRRLLRLADALYIRP